MDNGHGNDDESDKDNDDDKEREQQRVLGVEVENDANDAAADAYWWKFQPLYAVEVSGNNRQLFNNFPIAVAVLSNSKWLFFSHVDIMFQCLDPWLAELC